MSAPALSAEEMSRRQRKLDDRDTRLLTALTVLSAVTVAFCFALAFKVSQYSHGPRGTAASQTPADECREGEIPSGCADGETCQSGACVVPGAPSRCERGALCDEGCTCEEPLACDSRNVCTLAQDPGLCDDINVLDFLRLLQEKCGDASKCESKDLDKYAIDYADFLSLMTQFPSTLAIHFPDGKPKPLAARRWPNDEESTHYLNRLRDHIAQLLAADRIIMVGLASEDRRHKGDAEANRAITLQRLVTTHNLIYRSAASVLKPDEAEAINAKVRFINLGDQRAIDANFSKKRHGNVTIAWNPETEKDLRRLVEDSSDASPAELRWLKRTLNQVVFIIPIPCKLSGA